MPDKVANSLALGTSPIVRALIDPEGGMSDIRKLDNVSFTDWFKGHGGSQGSIDRMWDPIGESPSQARARVQVPGYRSHRIQESSWFVTVLMSAILTLSTACEVCEPFTQNLQPGCRVKAASGEHKSLKSLVLCANVTEHLI